MNWLHANIGPLASSLGLVLDIVSVVFLFKYGLPESIDRLGRDFIESGKTDEAQVSKVKRYDRMAYVGMALLLCGFALQFAGNWLKLREKKTQPKRVMN